MLQFIHNNGPISVVLVFYSSDFGAIEQILENGNLGEKKSNRSQFERILIIMVGRVKERDPQQNIQKKHRQQNILTVS